MSGELGHRSDAASEVEAASAAVVAGTEALLAHGALGLDTGPSGSVLLSSAPGGALLAAIDSVGQRREFRWPPRLQSDAVVFELARRLRELAAAAGEDDEDRFVVVVDWRLSGAERGRKLTLRPAAGSPFLALRRHHAETPLVPWMLGALEDAPLGCERRVPSEVVGRCEPRHVLDALAFGEALDVQPRRGLRSTGIRAGPSLELEIRDGCIVVAPARLPIRRSPATARVESGAWRVRVWTGSARGGVCPAENSYARAVAIVKGGVESLCWCLMGNPNRGPRQSPWLPRASKLGEHVLIGGGSIVTRLDAVWREGRVEALDRVQERLDRLSGMRRVSVVRGLGRGDPDVVNALAATPGPVIYAGVSASGDVRALLVVLDELAGDLQETEKP